MSTPAVKYSLAAAAGFAAASYADTADLLNPEKADGTALLPFGLKGSVLAAVLTFAAAQWGLKGQGGPKRTIVEPARQVRYSS